MIRLALSSIAANPIFKNRQLSCPGLALAAIGCLLVAALLNPQDASAQTTEELQYNETDNYGEVIFLHNWLNRNHESNKAWMKTEVLVQANTTQSSNFASTDQFRFREAFIEAGNVLASNPSADFCCRCSMAWVKWPTSLLEPTSQLSICRMRTFRFADSASFNPNDKFAIQPVVIYQLQTDGNPANGTNKWLSFGGRPVFFFNHHVFAGFRARFDHTSSATGLYKGRLEKFTIAPQIGAGRKSFSPPGATRLRNLCRLVRGTERVRRGPPPI